jgi:hypothetical protein
MGFPTPEEIAASRPVGDEFLRTLRRPLWAGIPAVGLWVLGGALGSLHGPVHALGLLLAVVGFLGTCWFGSMWWKYLKVHRMVIAMQREYEAGTRPAPPVVTTD